MPSINARVKAASGRDAIIADGYHRVCASYHTDENTDVPVRIVDLAGEVIGSRHVTGDYLDADPELSDHPQLRETITDWLDAEQAAYLEKG